MEYTIGDPSMTQTWTADEDLVTMNSYLDCGTYSFEWWMNNQNDEDVYLNVDNTARTITVEESDPANVG